MAENTIDFGTPKVVHSIFLTTNNNENLQQIGINSIRVGNDRSQFSSVNNIVKENIVSGGF